MIGYNWLPAEHENTHLSDVSLPSDTGGKAASQGGVGSPPGEDCQSCSHHRVSLNRVTRLFSSLVRTAYHPTIHQGGVMAKSCLCQCSPWQSSWRPMQPFFFHRKAKKQFTVTGSSRSNRNHHKKHRYVAQQTHAAPTRSALQARQTGPSVTARVGKSQGRAAEETKGVAPLIGMRVTSKCLQSRRETTHGVRWGGRWNRKGA